MKFQHKFIVINSSEIRVAEVKICLRDEIVEYKELFTKIYLCKKSDTNILALLTVYRISENKQHLTEFRSEGREKNLFELKYLFNDFLASN